ncbi:MAG TPA: hypothetical protein VGR71_16990 [Nitrospira sp.]|nr:hypothetical protein [Nitrospira sp.]
MRITVTWLDGMKETYRCDEWYVKEGVLFLVPDRHDPSSVKRCIPLRNVRIWTE